MREFLRTKGFKMTPQRELIFRAFFELGDHVTVDELYEKVRKRDRSIGYSTVWRNLKLICKVGLAEEVNVGDGVTRYDRVTNIPHGHMYCEECRKLKEFDVQDIVTLLADMARRSDFAPESFKIEIHGLCSKCRAELQRTATDNTATRDRAESKHPDTGRMR
jgi:Fur family ferric uptake transcriptional regulator